MINCTSHGEPILFISSQRSKDQNQFQFLGIFLLQLKTQVQSVGKQQKYRRWNTLGKFLFLNRQDSEKLKHFSSNFGSFHHPHPQHLVHAPGTDHLRVGVLRRLLDHPQPHQIRNTLWLVRVLFDHPESQQIRDVAFGPLGRVGHLLDETQPHQSRIWIENSAVGGPGLSPSPQDVDLEIGAACKKIFDLFRHSGKRHFLF